MRFQKRNYLALILCVLSVCSIVGLAEAATVDLAWDPPADADFAGIRMYRAPGACATPGAFAQVKIFGAVGSGSDSVPSDGDYCYAVTAVDTAGNESVQSNKVGVSVNLNPPGAPTNLRNIGVKP